MEDTTTSTAAAKRTASTTEETPYDLFQKQIKEVMNTHYEDGEALGTFPVRGPPHSGDSDDDDEEQDSDDEDAEEKNNSKLTQEQMDHVRVIIITKKRDAEINNCAKLILGDQYGDDFMMFNTSFSYQIMGALAEFRRKYNTNRYPADKFNKLFAFTYNLYEYDTWIYDHEEGSGLDQLTFQLGRWWKILLAKSDEELKIDGEFTRPGILCFLQKFQDALSQNEGDENFNMRLDDILST